MIHINIKECDIFLWDNLAVVSYNNKAVSIGDYTINETSMLYGTGNMEYPALYIISKLCEIGLSEKTCWYFDEICEEIKKAFIEYYK